VRPKVLVSRKVFDEALALLGKHFEVESNQRDVPFTPVQLVKKLQGKPGAIVLLTDIVDDRLLAQCPELKVVCNVAVGYNNIDVKAATRRGVMVCNTPGVLDDTTADSPGPCSSRPPAASWSRIRSSARGSGRAGA